MSSGFDKLSDRRRFPRLGCNLAARISDYHYEWDARCISVSAGGCFIVTDLEFEVGNDLEVNIVHPDGDEVRHDGMVRWARYSGHGDFGVALEFDDRKTERIEAMNDFVDRLAVVDVETAMRFREASRPLPMTTVLYIARDAPRAPVLTNEERAFLGCINGQATLLDIKHQMTEDEWWEMSYSPFSLLAKGVLTPSEARASPAHSYGGGRVPRAPTMGGQVTRQQAQARNAKAHAHLQQAQDALAANNKRMARTHLLLALQLAPGDAEISATLASLTDD